VIPISCETLSLFLKFFYSLKDYAETTRTEFQAEVSHLHKQKREEVPLYYFQHPLSMRPYKPIGPFIVYMEEERNLFGYFSSENEMARLRQDPQ